MKSRKRLMTLMVSAVCALAGTAVGISQSSAAKQSSKHRNSTQAPANGEMGGGRPPGGHGPGGPDHGAVHSVEVVLNKAGTAYVSETTDSGTIKEVDSSGGSITITEGIKSVTYGTPTITIPSDATVTLDGKTSTLSALKSGDQVTVSSSSDGTTVFAMDSSFKPAGGVGGSGGPGGGMGGSPPAGGSGSSGSSSGSSE
jgi:Cu/Ag efflux protein CusF